MWLNHAVLVDRFKKLKPKVGERIAIKCFGKHTDKKYWSIHLLKNWVLCSVTQESCGKEQDDFGLLCEASLVWFLARRKFAELVEPQIGIGHRWGNNDVTPILDDFSLTKQDWYRRRKELANSGFLGQRSGL